LGHLNCTPPIGVAKVLVEGWGVEFGGRFGNNSGYDAYPKEVVVASGSGGFKGYIEGNEASGSLFIWW